jgi:uncharacterized protein YegP (UPF0339 family)
MKNIALSALVVFAAACGVPEDVQSNDDLATTDGALTSKGRFETFTGQDGKYYFHLLAGNGEKVLASQGYTALSSAKEGIASVQANGTSAQKYSLREATDGAWYFVLIAGNNRIIAISEMYSSQSNATAAMKTTAAVVTATVADVPAQTNDPRFEQFKGLDGKYYFHVRAGNGEIVLQSQGYTTKASATNGLNSVNLNGSDTTKYEVLPAADGEFYFVLHAGNGQIIGRSETYVTESNAARGVQTVAALLTAPLPR